MNALECLLRAEKKEVKKVTGKIVRHLWIEKGMWEIDDKNLMNQIRMIKSKGWETNTEIETTGEKQTTKVGMKLMKVQCMTVITWRTLKMKMLYHPGRQCE